MVKRLVSLGVIPARAQSSRFPRKVIQSLLGKPLVQYIWESARRAKNLSRVLIATDDRQIFEVAKGFGADVVMTPPELPSGSDRVAHVVRNLDVDLVVNLQADEPTLSPSAIDELVEAIQNPENEMATLAVRMSSPEVLNDRNAVKVVLTDTNRALYFSRSPLASNPEGQFWKHIGIYAYRKDVLLRLAGLPPSPLELTERLEQLRALQSGVAIQVVPVSEDTLAVDTPEDLEKVEKYLLDHPEILDYLKKDPQI